MRLPLGMMCKETGEAIGTLIGEVQELEARADEKAMGRFLRVKVCKNIKAPLMRGFTLEEEDAEVEQKEHVDPHGKEETLDGKNWCPFEYEHLPDFCYVCGIIGHTDKACGVKLKKGEKPHLGGKSSTGWGRRSLSGSDGPSWHKDKGSAAERNESDEKGQDVTSPIKTLAGARETEVVKQLAFPAGEKGIEEGGGVSAECSDTKDAEEGDCGLVNEAMPQSNMLVDVEEVRARTGYKLAVHDPARDKGVENKGKGKKVGTFKRAKGGRKVGEVFIEGTGGYQEAIIGMKRGGDHMELEESEEHKKKKVEQGPRLPRFEAKWLLEEDCDSIVENTWGKAMNPPVKNRLAEVLGALSNWNREVLGDLRKRMKKIKAELEATRKEPISDHQVRKEQTLSFKLERHEEQENLVCRQRAHANWLTKGDPNTRYFHACGCDLYS
ncbi:hypothetical protein D1007_60705 [Hordeum vulgare]|nr:hypothetical protein D1007_60705 [Hordeum vulgare]